MKKKLTKKEVKELKNAVILAKKEITEWTDFLEHFKKILARKYKNV